MIVESAINLARKGCFVFPVTEGQKKPPIFINWQEKATRDEETIKKWWTQNPNYNVGISTSKFNGSNEALIVVDVDNKGDKNGDKALLELEMQGKDFPPTFTQSTPNKGRHLFYVVDKAVKQGTSVLGDGLDIRSEGGYVLGDGSKLENNDITYSIAEDIDFIKSPDWLPIACGMARAKLLPEQRAMPINLDSERAIKRAIHYLDNEAPLALQGSGGDETTYKVACKLKDFGVPQTDALNLLIAKWNDQCEPPWSMSELQQKVSNAYSYGNLPPGQLAPELEFEKIPTAEKDTKHPIDKINEEYAFVVAGGGSHILWETKDEYDRNKVVHLDLATFHHKLASLTMQTGDGEKPRPVSRIWMSSPKRKSYDGICFRPGLAAPKRYYNLWKGFSVTAPGPNEGLPREASDALVMFLDHAKQNICENNDEYFKWFMGYFAHIIQKPWEKPHSAIVLKGRKGVGKNVFVDCIGYLLSNHYMLTANKRYLLGNFNSHLENLLLFALDEAFWSGDKQAEGTLKDLITGKTHVIEHKGKEPYTVANCTRICILSNEEWAIPATVDERRFAVFNVGDARRQDTVFFQKMRQGMECGGYRLLFKYFLDYPLANIDLNSPPATEGLKEQKEASLSPFEQWWADCLLYGKILGSDFGAEWPEEIEKERIRNAYIAHTKARQIKTRIPNDKSLGKMFKKYVPSISSFRKSHEGERLWFYFFPSLDVARKEWEAHIGHETFDKDEEI